MPSRLLFGNESSIGDNLRDLRRRPIVARSAAGRVGADTAAVQRLVRDGFAAAPSTASPELVQRLQAATQLCEDPASSIAMGGRIPDSVRYVTDPLAKISELRDLLTPEIIDVVRGWFGSEFRITSVRFWRIASLPDGEQAYHHYGNQWHLDGHKPSMLKMFVQVDEVTAKGAAFRLVPRKATAHIMRSGYRARTRMSQHARDVIERETVCFDEPPGSILLADTNRCLHRAGIPPEGGTRAMIQFWFEPSSTPPLDGDYFAQIPHDENVAAGRVA
jgi:hypothetical protein